MQQAYHTQIPRNYANPFVLLITSRIGFTEASVEARVVGGAREHPVYGAKQVGHQVTLHTMLM